MLQENPFFSQPIIFYGSHDDSEEEEFLENWQISLDHSKNPIQQPPIGLFFHWFSPID